MSTRLIPPLIGLVALLVTACGGTEVRIGEPGEVQTKTERVELTDAEAVSVDVTLGAGEVTVTGGANALLDAQFRYDVEGWEPEVSYEEQDGQGRLRVYQPGEDIDVPTGRTTYVWDLALGGEAPLALNITVGAGDLDLDLSALRMSDLNVRTGVGEIVADLTGTWPSDADINIDGGVGQATLRLPADVGVAVEVTGGVGSVEAIGLRKQQGVYVNDAFGESEVNLNVEVTGGVGEVVLEVVESE